MFGENTFLQVLVGLIVMAITVALSIGSLWFWDRVFSDENKRNINSKF